MGTNRDSLRLSILIVMAGAMAACLALGILRPDLAGDTVQGMIHTARDFGGLGWVLLVMGAILLPPLAAMRLSRRRLDRADGPVRVPER